MADWSTRLAPEIELVSPSGIHMFAKWRGNDRSHELQNQQDKFPLFPGRYGKALGADADEYQITLYFDGPSCDLRADEFFQATKEIGIWEIQHPVHGYLPRMLPMSVSEKNDPITSGGVVVVETRWFEPLELADLQTSKQIAGVVDALFNTAINASAANFAALAKPSGWGGLGSLLKAASVIGIIAQNISAMASSSGSVSASGVTFATIKGQADVSKAALDTKIAEAWDDSDDFDAEGISLDQARIFQTAALGNTDGDAALDALTSGQTDVIAVLPSSSKVLDLEDSNKARVAETALDAIMASSCLAMTYAEPTTRAQAIQMAQDVQAMFDTMVDQMDATYELFSDLRADEQYYSQLETYGILREMVTQAIKYLMSRVFDLAIEKRTTLGEDKTPLQICIEEYGAVGENKFDDFISWNDLEKDEILLLPAGREVVTYIEVA